MHYMLLIDGGEAAMANATEAEQQAEMAKWFEYTEEMRSSRNVRRRRRAAADQHRDHGARRRR